MINDLNSTLSTIPRLFSLVSASLLTKYTGFTSLAIGGLPNRIVNRDADAAIPIFLLGFQEYMTALTAMMAHSSQMVWFRWLYVGWSRYMWTNSWELVHMTRLNYIVESG